jgi:hypothetical protein
MADNTKEAIQYLISKWFDTANQQLTTIDVTGQPVLNPLYSKDASYEQIIAAVTDKSTGALRISQ